MLYHLVFVNYIWFNTIFKELIHFYWISTSTPKSFSAGLLHPFIPQPLLIVGVAPTQVQDPALGLVEPHEVHTAPLLDLVQVPLDGMLSFWLVNCTAQLGVICKLAEGTLSLTMSLMKILNNSGPSMDPWGTALVTSIHLDIKPLTTTLWLRPSNQFLIHQTVHPSNPYLSSLERRMLWGTVSKALQMSR